MHRLFMSTAMYSQPIPLSEQSLTTSAHSSTKRSAARSRNGCWTCRSKKVKCDEARPQCRRCLRLKLHCDYVPRKKEPKFKIQMVLSKRSRVDSNWEGNSTACQSAPTGAWLQSLLRRHEAMSLSTFSIPMSATSASSVTLTATDHEAIRYFRTTFAKLNHTKNSDYSLYSIMFKIAETNPMVMHMVLAVGGREMEFQRNLCTKNEQGVGSPLWHYSKALKLMADVIGNESANALDLDIIHTALYLMLLYEQKYGDDTCTGVTNHLDGAALILTHRFKNESSTLPPVPGRKQPLALSSDANGTRQNDTISFYAARIIMWMAGFDTSAASFGVGGHLNATLYKLMSTNPAAAHTVTYSQPLEKFEQLHSFSYPLYRTTWGDQYPQSELLDDVENRNIFSLGGACAQLRFMVAQLSKLRDNDSDAAQKRISNVELCIDDVETKFSELMEVAAGLSITTDNSHRLVVNIRSIVPQYYAVVLYFFRFKFTPEQSLAERQHEALRQIMNLAFQAHKFDGEKAMVRIAWPLFMVALETNDQLHCEWVLRRFHEIRKFGHNLERAYQFLSHVVDLQNKLGKRVDIREMLESGEFGRFVI